MLVCEGAECVLEGRGARGDVGGEDAQRGEGCGDVGPGAGGIVGGNRGQVVAGERVPTAAVGSEREQDEHEQGHAAQRSEQRASYAGGGDGEQEEGEPVRGNRVLAGERQRGCSGVLREGECERGAAARQQQ